MTRECPEPEFRAIRELPLPVLWLFGTLGLTGLIFSWLLRRCEVGVHGHGLETIRRKVCNVAGSMLLRSEGQGGRPRV